MNHSLRSVLLLAALLGAAISISGCTPTPTQQPAEQAIDDGVVTAKVRAALTDDPMTRTHDIEVETFEGRVQLRGFVESDAARARALQITRSVEGVKKVEDALQVPDSSG